MAGTTSIIARVKELSHQAADELCSQVLGEAPARTVVLDLHQTEDASTAAFARLVLLRRDLLKDGRDLRLRGLKARAAQIWRVNRLASVLPVQ
ncbi:MAG TPA: STAS domain-containing protein [Humisphaera sp.]